MVFALLIIARLSPQVTYSVHVSALMSSLLVANPPVSRSTVVRSISAFGLASNKYRAKFNGTLVFGHKDTRLFKLGNVVSMVLGGGEGNLVVWLVWCWVD